MFISVWVELCHVRLQCLYQEVKTPEWLQVEFGDWDLRSSLTRSFTSWNCGLGYGIMCKDNDAMRFFSAVINTWICHLPSPFFLSLLTLLWSVCSSPCNFSSPSHVFSNCIVFALMLNLSVSIGTKCFVWFGTRKVMEETGWSDSHSKNLSF